MIFIYFSMAKKKQPNRHIAEITGILLLGFAVFLMWCLISYDPRDPSFGTGVSSIPKDLWKRGGRAGAYMASLLFGTMGLGAFAVPAVALLGAIKILFRPGLQKKMYLNYFYCFLLFLILETFFSLFLGELAVLKYSFDAGGAIVGAKLAGLLTGYLGQFGAWLVLLIALLLTFMGLTRISYVTLWTKVADPAGRFLLKCLRELLSFAKERYKEWTANRLMEKKKKSLKAKAKPGPARRSSKENFEFSFDDMPPVEEPSQESQAFTPDPR